MGGDVFFGGSILLLMNSLVIGMIILDVGVLDGVDLVFVVEFFFVLCFSNGNINDGGLIIFILFG